MMTRRLLLLFSAALKAFPQVTPQRLEEQAQAYYDADLQYGLRHGQHEVVHSELA